MLASMIRAAQNPKVKDLDKAVKLKQPPHEGRRRLQDAWWKRRSADG